MFEIGKVYKFNCSWSSFGLFDVSLFDAVVPNTVYHKKNSNKAISALDGFLFTVLDKKIVCDDKDEYCILKIIGPNGAHTFFHHIKEDERYLKYFVEVVDHNV